mgnify:CR=1 FL=1
MKKIKFIFNCLTNVIKKKIFKVEKTHISPKCEKALNLNKEVTSIEELKLTEEYVREYNVTTRWQTI